MIEYKALGSFEMSDMDKEHRTAVIAHAHYDNIDRFGDISRKGMFNKSWQETKASDIIFDVDHNLEKQPGLVKKTFEDEHKAYTKVWFGTHTLGNDTMLMMDEGIIRGASFKFVVEKKGDLNIKGKKVRELKEVRHLATTVTLTIVPVNSLAGVVSVNKAMDLDSLLSEYKARIEKIESFCRNTNASDDCIINLQEEIKGAKQFLSSFDTALTGVINQPDASRDDNDREAFRKKLLLFNLQLSS